MAPEPWDEPLFDIPKPYRKPAPKKAESWRRYTAAKRLSCDLCILDVHMGIATIPLSPARHVYTTGERVWNLCATHGSQVKTGARKLPH